MKQGNHRIVTENKNYPEFKKGNVVNVKDFDSRKGLYEISGKQYRARVLKGIMSPVKENQENEQ